MTRRPPTLTPPEIDLSWHDQAACAGADQDVFFPVSGSPTARADADAICARCPVVDDCLNYALATRQEHGIWAGTNENERHTIVDQRRHTGDAGNYWPTGFDAPRRSDGTVDVPALCRLYDDLVNQGLNG